MSNLLTAIKETQLAARKTHNTIVATLLTTIIGEAVMVGKSAGNRESTDVEVLTTLKKFEKSALENLRIFTERSKTDLVDLTANELAIIRSFLPAKLSDQQVQDDITNVIFNKGLVPEQKSMGVISKELKVKYGDQFDGQQVSTIFKKMIG